MTTIVTERGRVTPGKSWPLAGANPSPGVISTDLQAAIPLMGTAYTYEQMYRSQTWVYTLVNKISRGIARLPLKTYEVGPDGDRSRVRDHPLAQLFRTPYPGGTKFRLVESAWSNLCLHGNALWLKSRPAVGQPPTQLWPCPWRYVSIIRGEEQAIAAYVVTVGKVRRAFPAYNCVHFSWFGTELEEIGISPLEPLRETLASEWGAKRYSTASFANAARPSAVVTPERNMTPEARDEIKAEIQTLYTGPDNAFKVALLRAGMNWQQVAHSAQEAELVNVRKLNREEVCAAYDVPPPMVGILDHATYSNIDQQHWMLYMDTFGPMLGLTEETLLAQLITSEGIFQDTFCEFDLNEVLKGNMEQRSQAYQRLLPVYTINELRERENLRRLDDPAADRVYVPLNTQAVGPGAAPASPPAGATALVQEAAVEAARLVREQG